MSTKKPEQSKEVVRLVDYSNRLDAAILQVRKDGVKLKHKIHNVALSIITVWGKKNISGQQAADYFSALCEASSYHGKALANWVSLKLPLKFSEETDKWYCPPDAKVNGDTFKAARDEPFWEVSPPPEPKPIDFTAMIYALLAKNSKAQSEDTIKKKAKKGISDKVIPTDVARKIKEILAQNGITEA